MTKRNKILLTIVITAFVALSTCLVASAQAPDVEIDFSSNSGIMHVIVYDDQTTNVVMLLYSNTNFVTGDTEMYCVLTENYYENYKNTDVSDIVNSRFEITVSSFTANGGGPSRSYVGNIVCSLNAFFDLFVTPDGIPYSPITDTLLTSSINNAIRNQFTYWEMQFQVQFDNGFAEGQQAGLQTGYTNGYNTGYNDAISDSDAYLEGLFAVFDAPFVFLENLGSFEVFGITIIDVITFLLIICFALFIYKVIRRFLPI